MVINVLEYLEQAASNYPDKIAFEDEHESVSYAEFTQRAQAIGSYLLKNKTQNKPILVLIDRTIHSLAAFMGVVYSGNFYVPLDIQMPKQRINLILETLQPQAAVVREKDLTFLKELNFFGETVVYEKAALFLAQEQQLAAVRKKSIDVDPLYAMFTSGSTGMPKGVLISHRSVIDLMEQFADTFAFQQDEVFGNQAPFDFDVSVKDIYMTFRCAAKMQIVPKMLFSFPGKLISFLNERKVTTAIWATSALRIIANLCALEQGKPLYLRNVLFSGEVMPNKVLNYWRAQLPVIRYVNLYGPTEITCNCTYFVVDRPFADEETLPIGIPFRNTEILLFNEHNHLAQQNEVGEICVRGSSLALGYYNNSNKTAESFCQVPLYNSYRDLIYRTGDIGKYNERGELMFVSRKDFQVKHMGHRIELGEIEVTVNALAFLHAGCCIYDKQHEKIVLFYEAEEACEQKIARALLESLPKYMLPNRMVFMKKLPMNKNAKIDRVRLKEILTDETHQ